MNQEYYKFQLSFKGNLIENSVDAYDVANSILGITSVLSEVSFIKYGSQSKNIKININAFKQGSLQSEFLVYLNPATAVAAALIPLAPQGFQIGKEILESLKTYLEVRKFLKGKPPQKVTPTQDGMINIVGDNNKVIVVASEDLRILQDKSVSRHIEKMVAPLTKESSVINQITIDEDSKKISSISKEEAAFLRSEDQFQNIPNLSYKGTVSKIDTKACSGFLDLGSKRISFSFPESLEKKKFHILVESLENRIQIYLSGSVVMDYEGTPSRMDVADVYRDEKLF